MNPLIRYLLKFIWFSRVKVNSNFQVENCSKYLSKFFRKSSKVRIDKLIWWEFSVYSPFCVLKFYTIDLTKAMPDSPFCVLKFYTIDLTKAMPDVYVHFSLQLKFASLAFVSTSNLKWNTANEYKQSLSRYLYRYWIDLWRRLVCFNFAQPTFISREKKDHCKTAWIIHFLFI